MSTPSPTEDDYSVLEELDTRWTTQRDEGFAYFSLIVGGIVALIMLILVITNGVKLYQDLFGDRKALFKSRVDKGRPLPAFGPTYKWINILTELTLVLYFGSSFTYFISFTSESSTACNNAFISIMSLITVAKTCMSLVFLFRLQRVYNESPYKFPARCINLFVIILVVYTIIVIVVISIIVRTKVIQYQGVQIFPNLCVPEDVTLFAEAGTLILGMYIMCAIGFHYGYKIPLEKTYDCYVNKKPLLAKKIRYSGRKANILVGTATICTIILGVLPMITQIAVIAIPDSIVSSLCIMFMTAYYPDDIWYQKFCCLCKKICHSPIGDEDKDDAVPYNEESYRTVDTMSKVRVAASKLTVSYQYGQKPQLDEQEMKNISDASNMEKQLQQHLETGTQVDKANDDKTNDKTE